MSKTISDRLREFNAWRRGAETEQPNPADIGNLLDTAADRLDVLERESREHYEKWHAERRRREELEQLVELAAEDVSDWGGYASKYFQDKHDLEGCIEKYKRAVAHRRIDIAEIGKAVP